MEMVTPLIWSLNPVSISSISILENFEKYKNGELNILIV
jgi:hypothetical protein